jgi:heme/copper-type cytochrome/quinol oxidase subunit 3
MNGQRVLDVSRLERGTTDSRALIWWGNLGMLAIEGTMFLMAIATFLYLRSANLDWPPSTVPNPDLFLPTLNLGLLLVGGIGALITERAAARGAVGAAQVGQVVSIAAGIAFLAVRVVVMAHIGYKWSDHAYGSIVWTIVGLHTFHMLTATGETALLFVYSLTKPMVKRYVLDFRTTAVYWYFVALIWLPFYFLIFVEPWLPRKGY